MSREKNNPPKCPICGRATHKESKYCIFHASMKEKTEEEFKEALKDYVQEIKEEGIADYDFRKFIFNNNIDFKKDLIPSTSKILNFEGASFKKDVNFRYATFKGNLYFKNVTFNGLTNFEYVTFTENAYFRGATFKKDANFSFATFKGNGYFKDAVFYENANFENATFKGKTYFIDTTLKKNISFEGATFAPGIKLALIVEGKGNIFFKCTFLENVFLELNLGKGALVDFTDTLLRNTKINKKQIESHIIYEERKEYLKAKEIYMLLKNNFHSIGRYRDESWAFQKEKEMERKSYYFNAFTKNIESKEEKKEEKDQQVKKSKVISYSNWMKAKEFGKWLWSCFCNTIYGYGEKPQHVIISAGVIIILFALLFSSIGISNPEIIDLKGITVDQNTGNIVDSASKGLLRNNVIRNIPDSLYFSLITFTTLGYGDFRPLEGWGRILAGSEAFIGAFMMALFVYTFARRTGGR